MPLGKKGDGGDLATKKGEAKIDHPEFLNDPLLIEGKHISTLALLYLDVLFSLVPSLCFLIVSKTTLE